MEAEPPPPGETKKGRTHRVELEGRAVDGERVQAWRHVLTESDVEDECDVSQGVVISHAERSPPPRPLHRKLC